MLTNLVRTIKIKFKNKFGSIIISIGYIIFNKFILGKKYFKIYKLNKYWIHQTEIGLLSNTYPIFNPDLYIKTKL